MDLNRNAFRIVQSLTGDKKQALRRSTAARAGGKVGGPARAKMLTPAQRREIAMKANRTRWHKTG